MNAFATLADDTRREIAELVALNGGLTSTKISENFEMSPPAISQQLKVSREANVLTMKKQAQKRLYDLSDNGIEDWLIDKKKLWNKRLDCLDKYLLELKKE